MQKNLNVGLTFKLKVSIVVLVIEMCSNISNRLKINLKNLLTLGCGFGYNN